MALSAGALAAASWPTSSAASAAAVQPTGSPSAALATAAQSDPMGICADAPNGYDDTATLRAAIAGRKILRPGVYFYKGGGEDVLHPWLVGSLGATEVRLPDGVFLFDCTKALDGVRIEGVDFHGGAGVFRNRYQGENVAGYRRIRDNLFYNFTDAAISHNSYDMPYWVITGNRFIAGNDRTSVCIALAGMCDSSVIANNAFIRYRVGIKLGPATSGTKRGHFANVDIGPRNDFVQEQGASGEPRAAVWLVPLGSDFAQDNSDAGCGTNIFHNKFGTENLQAGDARILIAPERSGSTFGDRLPALTASSGVVNGLRIYDNNVVSGFDGAPPLVRCYTSNFVSSYVVRNQFSGNLPAVIVQYEAGVTPRQRPELTIGGITRQWSGVDNTREHSQTMRATNVDVNAYSIWTDTRNRTDANQMIPFYG